MKRFKNLKKVKKHNGSKFYTASYKKRMRARKQIEIRFYFHKREGMGSIN